MERMSHVFSRVLGGTLPVVSRAEGALIWDTDGRRYIDGAGGAIVVGIGHGRAEVARAVADQSARVAYAHGTAFTSEPLEEYADALAQLLPMDDARIYPVSGGSEAVETALKLARAYHLAREHARRARRLGPRAAPPPVRPLAGTGDARHGRLRVPVRAAGPSAGMRRGPRRRAGCRDPP
jgi:adenosylmethionine-8-amino-7-oxononanoate aminotransferase